MAFQFNPFTGTFDLVNDASSATSVGTSSSAVIADWVGNTLNIAHNLGTLNPIVTVYEAGEIIWVDTITVVDANNIQITANAPFDVTVVVVKP